jgi:hypothetical protein
MRYLVHRDIYQWVNIEILFLKILKNKKYLILGAIAVISLMTGNVVDRLSVKPTLTTLVPMLLNNSTIGITSNEVLIDPSYAVTIATTLAFTVGIIHVI